MYKRKQFKCKKYLLEKILGGFLARKKKWDEVSQMGAKQICGNIFYIQSIVFWKGWGDWVTDLMQA